MKRVVVTGTGIYSVLGKNLEETTKSLYEGRSGIVFDAERKKFGMKSGLTGKLERPNLKRVIPRRIRVGMPQQAEYAYMATSEALKNAKIDQDYLNKNTVGIIYGNDSSSIPVIEAIDKMRKTQDSSLIGSGSIFQSMNSTVSMNLSVLYKLKGINLSISAACASGSHSIGLGFLLIQQGLQEAIICGGAQELNMESMASFDALNAFSMREDEPQKASRPFDADRDGLVPGGGAATVILEEYESAVKRGAPILGEVLGYGFSSNGEHISVPNVDGPAKSLELAMKSANLQAKDIDYLNAHATSTPVGDINEAQAIARIFGNKLPVSSTKSMTGHEMWMGGASEIVYSLLMAKESFIAPNINFNRPDEHSAKINVIPETKNAKINIFLSNSFGFGGTNSSLIVKNLQ